MNRRRRWLLLLALVPFGAGAVEDVTGYEVVGNVLSLDATRLHGSSNLYPWQEGGKTLDDIVVSNGCGFIDIVYAAVPLPDYLSAIGEVHWAATPYRAPIGEWCALKPVVFDYPTLVEFTTWKGTRFLIRSAGISIDVAGDRDPYVTDVGFIADYQFRRNGPKALEPGACCAKRMYLREFLPPAGKPGPNGR